MQEKVAQIYNLVQDTRNIQIKGGKQLEELESYVQVTSSKFDEYKIAPEVKRKNYKWLTVP